MQDLSRFGVSIDKDLLESFDDFCKLKNYKTRSEALRDLMRAALVEGGNFASEEVVGSLTLIYNHHKSELSQKLVELQHDSHVLVSATLHIHLDHNNCLEVLILKGVGRDVEELSSKILSIKGVFHGKLVVVPLKDL